MPSMVTRSSCILAKLTSGALSSTTLRSWFRTSSRPTALFMSSEASSCRQRRRPPRARRLPTKAQIARALAMRPSGGEERLPEYEVPFEARELLEDTLAKDVSPLVTKHRKEHHHYCWPRA